MNSNRTFPFKYIARILFVIPGIFLLVSFAGCGSPKERKIIPAFYFWKTNLRISSYEQKILNETYTEALYVRLFDIGWDEQKQQPQPVGMLQGDTLKEHKLQYVPVVYITQPCLIHLREKDLPELAANMNHLITQLCDQYGIMPGEIQIDCDWTRTSSGIYFSLLRQLKEQPFFRLKLISCTIRLHQVKFSATSGIPPVDRGMLMVYNMGNLTKYGGHNSILDPEEARSYLKHTGIYPLPLDVALPLYHWAVLFEQRRFKGILYNLAKEQFPAGALQHKKDNLYALGKTMKVGGYLLEEGQEIRFENPGAEALHEVASYLGSRLKAGAFRLAFFHLDSTSMQPYKPEVLNSICTDF